MYWNNGILVVPINSKEILILASEDEERKKQDNFVYDTTTNKLKSVTFTNEKLCFANMQN